MSVLEHTFNTQPSLQLFLCLYFLLPQGLTARQRWELRAFLGLFWARTLTMAHAWLSRFPGICGSFSKLTPQLFLPSFSACVLLASTDILCLSWQQLVLLPLNVFNKSIKATSLPFEIFQKENKSKSDEMKVLEWRY